MGQARCRSRPCFGAAVSLIILLERRGRQGKHALSGLSANLDEIRRELQKADYPSLAQPLSGTTMKRQLKALIKSSRAVAQG